MITTNKTISIVKKHSISSNYIYTFAGIIRCYVSIPIEYHKKLKLFFWWANCSFEYSIDNRTLSKFFICQIPILKCELKYFAVLRNKITNGRANSQFSDQMNDQNIVLTLENSKKFKWFPIYKRTIWSSITVCIKYDSCQMSWVSFKYCVLPLLRIDWM